MSSQKFQSTGHLSTASTDAYSWVSLEIEFSRLRHNLTQEQRIRTNSRRLLLPVQDSSLHPNQTVAGTVKIAELLIENIFNSQIITSDRDPNLTSNFWKSLFKTLETELQLSTAFHPEMNGKRPRLNQTLEIVLRHYLEDHLNTWTKYLPILEFAYSSARHSATGKLPFLEDTLIHRYLLPLLALNHKWTLLQPR